MPRRQWIVVTGLLLLAVPPSLAEAPASRHSVSLGVGQFMATGDSTFSGDPFDYAGTTFKNEFDDEIGLSVGYEYRVTDLIGIQAGIGYYEPELGMQIYFDETDVESAALVYDWKDSVRVLPLTLGANFHLFRGGKVDFYVGPELAYVTYSTFESPLGPPEGMDPDEARIDVEFEDEFTFGVRAGINVPIGEKWTLGASLEYLAASAKVDKATVTYSVSDPALAAEEVEDIPFYKGREFEPTPLVLSIGASYRF